MMHPSPVVRTCIGCGQRELQSSLLRLQVDVAGELVVIKTPERGRSAYLHVRQDCVSGLLRSKGLGRSLRTTVAREARQRAVLDLVRVVKGDPSGDGRDTCGLGEKAQMNPAARSRA